MTRRAPAYPPLRVAVVAAAGSAKRIIDGENGLVFRNRDATSLAGMFRRLSGDALLRQRLGENARAAVGTGPDDTLMVDEIGRIYAAVGASQASISLVRRLLLYLRPFARNRISATALGRLET